MSDRTDAKRAWVERVLGIRAEPIAQTRGGLVVYRKLLLRWRGAQSTFAANLKSFGSVLLAHPKIQADPRIAEIKQAVAELPKLVPEFGGALEDVLDAGLNATEPAEVQRLAVEGIAAIDAYRTKLQSASQLKALEQFATKELGAGLPLHSELEQALVELRQQLVA